MVPALPREGAFVAWGDRARVPCVVSGGVGGRVWLVWLGAPDAFVFSPASLEVPPLVVFF